MLHNLVVKNFAIIENLNIDFGNNLSVITGDSGAGKSIILAAINLALGGRADKSQIRAGQNRAVVVADFENNSQNVKQFLENNDLGDGCILRRVITNNSSKAYINDIPVSLNLIKELALLLVNISSQNSHQLLLKPTHQMQIVDDFAGNFSLLSEVKNLAKQINTLTQQISTIENSSANNKQQLDFLNFQLSEIQELNLEQDELENIEQKYKFLTNSQELLADISTINDLLIQENPLDNAISLLQKNTKLEPKLEPTLEMLESAKINIEEASYEISNYLSLCDINPDEVAEITQRFSILNDMSRKHNCQIIDLIDKKLAIEQEILTMSSSGESVLQLQEKRQELENLYLTTSDKLSKSRIKAAAKINILVENTINELGMNGAEFKINIEQHNNISSYGIDNIEFLIKTNQGSDFQSLKKTASGGELSRISLAIMVATIDAENNFANTLIFDEVDVGISGNAASVVGEKLKNLSKTNQVLCITHLPQVASFAQNHLLISKTQSENQTSTMAKYLDKTARAGEIARILGGDNISDKTLALAKEMINANSSNS